MHVHRGLRVCSWNSKNKDLSLVFLYCILSKSLSVHLEKLSYHVQQSLLLVHQYSSPSKVIKLLISTRHKACVSQQLDGAVRLPCGHEQGFMRQLPEIFPKHRQSTVFPLFPSFMSFSFLLHRIRPDADAVLGQAPWPWGDLGNRDPYRAKQQYGKSLGLHTLPRTARCGFSIRNTYGSP